jgi:CBS domain-containing protein
MGISGIPVPVRSVLRHKGPKVWSVAPETSVYEAIGLMAEKSIGALPVIADGVLVGILSERDYARKVALQSRSSKDTVVGEIMATSVISVTPAQTVEECMSIMTQRRIRHLPVVEHGQVVGIVSIGDLVRTVVATQGEIIQHLQEYISGRQAV